MYMNKVNKILICIIIALVSGAIGFMIGINVKGLSIKEKNIVGTYKTGDWNGKEAILVLQKDKTMIHPMGYNGIWFLNDGKLYIEYDYIDTFAQSIDESIAGFSVEDKQAIKKDYTKHERQEVRIVEGGLMLNGHFFEKVNK